MEEEEQYELIDEYDLEAEDISDEEFEEEEVKEDEEIEELVEETTSTAEDIEEIEQEIAAEALPWLTPFSVKDAQEKDDNHLIIRVVPDDERITSEIIQHEEMVEAIGIRISQIEAGSPVFTDVSGLTSPIVMAKKEFIDRKNPLILERHLYTTSKEKIVEHWKVREMTIQFTNRDVIHLTEKEINEMIKK